MGTSLHFSGFPNKSGKLDYFRFAPTAHVWKTLRLFANLEESQPYLHFLGGRLNISRYIQQLLFRIDRPPSRSQPCESVGAPLLTADAVVDEEQARRVVLFLDGLQLQKIRSPVRLLP